MKAFSAALILLSLVAIPTHADTSVSVQVGTSGFEFGFLYSDHYRADEKVIRHCAAEFDEQDLVVAFHLARMSGVEISVILDWRRKDTSWHDITRRCNLHNDVFFVVMESDPGPPYGRAYGHWKKNPKKAIVLSDDEIRAFSVLRAMSEYTGQPAKTILAERKKGRRPVDIAKSSRKGGPGRTEDAASPVPGKSKSKSKSKGKK